MTNPQWEHFAIVVRSPCHDRTWIGHIREAGFDDTPAGPLGVVKRAVQAEATEWSWRWRHNADKDVWVLEVLEDD